MPDGVRLAQSAICGVRFLHRRSRPPGPAKKATCRSARVGLADSHPFHPLYGRPDCSSDWCVLCILGCWFSAVLLGPGGGLISFLPAAGALTCPWGHRDVRSALSASSSRRAGRASDRLLANITCAITYSM